jgi:hypothetical protein
MYCESARSNQRSEKVAFMNLLNPVFKRRNSHQMFVASLFIVWIWVGYAHAASGPVITAGPTATPNPVTGTTAALSVTATGTSLVYTWATSGTPPAAVTFSPNGTSTANASTATFTKAGIYTITVTVKDSHNSTVVGTISNLNVNQTITIVVTPSSATVAPLGTQQFSASAKDQFGATITPQPTFGWTVAGGGSISSAGLFTAGGTAGGPFTVTATASGKSGTASVTVRVNAAPTVATPASATPNPATGTTSALSVLGTDDGGEPNLTYVWSASGTPPGTVTFSANNSNAAKSCTATFGAIGTYNLVVTITDTGALSTTSSVSVVVNPTLTTIAVTPASATINPSTTQQFSASGKDQFGNTLASQPTFTWTVGGGGTINASSGLFTAGATAGGPFTVTAAASGKSGTASVRVNAAPTVATAASASPSAVTAKTSTLSVLGADDSGEANLIYTWGTTGTPPAAVTFSVNGTNASKSTVVTFAKAGSYSLQAVIRDAQGLSVSSTVAVTVSQTFTAVTVTGAPRVNPSATDQFTAKTVDQFGIQMASQPSSFSWSASGGGTINSSGLYTAGSTSGGPFTITATTSKVSGTKTVIINARPTISNLTANPSPVTGTTTVFQVFAADDNGADITYTWTVTAGPAAVSFSPNGTLNSAVTTATFIKAGSYNIQVACTDADGLTLFASWTGFSVLQTPTSLGVSPANASIHTRSTQQFTATGTDQFGNALTSQPSVTWSVSGGGTISTTGLFTANSTAGGPFTVTAVGSGFTATAQFTTFNSAPTFNPPGAPASANPSIVDGQMQIQNGAWQFQTGATTLTCNATDDSGAVTYSWSVAGPGGGNVTFGTPSASQTTATITAPGVYTFQVTATDAEGLTSTSSVAVTVRSTIGGIISSNTSVPAGTYYINNEITINSGITLTLAPGVILKSSGHGFGIHGTLNAIGTQALPIYFTSIKDDTVGGDFNADSNATSPAAGDWSNIEGDGGSTIKLTYCEVRWSGGTFNGNSGYTDAALNFTGPFSHGAPVLIDIENSVISDSRTNGIEAGADGTVTWIFKNSLIRNCAGEGLGLGDGTNISVTATGNTLQDNGGFGLDVPPWVDISTNIFAGANGSTTGVGNVGNVVNVQNSSLRQDVTWATPTGSTGLYFRSVDVPVGRTLTIAPGTVIKSFYQSGVITVEGTILANGTPNNRIYFTSTRDNDPVVNGKVPNETNPPAQGNWGGIEIQPSAITQLKYCDVRYAGNYNPNTGQLYANIVANSPASIDIENCNIIGAGEDGIVLIPAATPSNWTILNTTISNCVRDGLDLTSGLTNVTPLFSGITLQNNPGFGFLGQATTYTIPNSNFTNNVQGGAKVTQSGIVDARTSWWGDPSGPNAGTGTGSGQLVTGNVLYNPWRIAATPAAPLINSARFDSTTFDVGGSNGIGAVKLYASFVENSNWTVTVLSGASTIRTYTGSGTTLTQSWDGRDSSNVVVPNGKYTINWSVTSTVTNGRTEQLTGFVNVNNTAAIASIDAPLQDQLVHSGDNLVVTYSVRGFTGGDVITSYDLAYGFGTEPTTWTNLPGFPATYSGIISGATASFTVPTVSATNITLRLRALAGANVSCVTETVLGYSGFTNQAPTISTPAGTSSNPVTTKTVTLSVLGADDSGEGNLTYIWQTTGTPPGAVSFNPNNNNAAKSTTATFAAGGTYNFQVTLRDTQGLTVTSSVTVNVNLALTSITLAPATSSVSINHTCQFTAVGFDQFNVALAPQPTFNWSSTGGGTFNSTGLFIAGNAVGGPFTVTAALNGVSKTSSISVTNNPPSILTDAYVSGVLPTSIYLKVVGNDDDGESTLTYTWTTTGTPPAPVTFSANGNNAAKDTVATVTAPGTYNFRVTILDSRTLSVTSATSGTITPIPSGIAITPVNAGVDIGTEKQFTAVLNDQFGSPVDPQPTNFTWSVPDGSVDQTGLFTAPNTTELLALTAHYNNLTGQANTMVTNPSPVAMPLPFNPSSFSTNPAYRNTYLISAEPGRVFQSADGAAGISQIKPAGSRMLSVAAQGQVTVSVVAAANAPVSFYANGDGHFLVNGRAAITVLSDAQGNASAVYVAPGGGKVPILAASPLSSGQVRFAINVGP